MSTPPPAPPLTTPQRVLLLGASGTIGRATAAALRAEGHDVTAVVRATPLAPRLVRDLDGCRIKVADVTDPAALPQVMAEGGPFDAVVSCLASRSGVPADAWAIDHDAQQQALAAAKANGVRHFVLLSAICVQKPRLAFQRAKLAFERSLQQSGLTWSIVRPTAFFKSLSGQVARVQAGQPFLVFGDGRLTACKPISDRDCGAYLAGCLREPARWNAVLPIGGPGPAITPRQQAEILFGLLGRPPRLRHVPPVLLDAIIAGLAIAGRLVPALAAKAELARIGRYYAGESMLVWDADAGRYDADATPETGSDTLAAHYAALLRGDVATDLGAHAVF
jgi:divinyl chlorophyllide a 8-vinyl-reductase